MTDWDEQVKKWAADQLKEPGAAVVSVTTSPEIDCWSSWTCDYDLVFVVTFDNGKTRRLGDWKFPEALKRFAEWVDAQDELHKEHAEYHGWNEEE